jgi:hypothetical protein
VTFPYYLTSLEEAKQSSDGYVVIEGDSGGICYLVCPANQVSCDENTLRSLAHDLEEAIYPRDPSGATLRYQRLTLGQELGGYALGEDHGIALRTLWLPAWLTEAGLSKKIQQVIAGENEKLDLSVSEQIEVEVLHKEYHAQKFEEETRSR